MRPHLKACTSLYDDGVRIFINLCNLKKAIASNPQGIVATASMNNLIYRDRHRAHHGIHDFKGCHSQGWQREYAHRCRTKQDPLGTERPSGTVQQEAVKAMSSASDTTPWPMSGTMSRQEMLDRNNAEIASQALGRWRRCAQSCNTIRKII